MDQATHQWKLPGDMLRRAAAKELREGWRGQRGHPDPGDLETQVQVLSQRR